MKNRNDAGTLHFDSSTAERLVLLKFRVRLGGVDFEIPVATPLTIKKALKQDDLDEARDALPRWYAEHCAQAIMSGVFDMERINARIGPLLCVRAAQHLYQKFILAQAVAGNEAWQAPPTMTEIGPPPEEDEAYNVGDGRLM
jgi:hypothetical protein